MPTEAAPIAAPVPASTPNPSVSRAVLATLERGACYGVCPIYKLTVREDGTVEYDGERFVKVRGKAEGRLDAAGVSRLKQAFETARFGSFAAAYEQHSITDMPTAVVSFGDGAKAKVVRHYFGDESAPAALTALEQELDAIVQVEQWIGTAEDRRKNAGSWR